MKEKEKFLEKILDNSSMEIIIDISIERAREKLESLGYDIRITNDETRKEAERILSETCFNKFHLRKNMGDSLKFNIKKGNLRKKNGGF